ncbi:zf-BED domain-containing protein [Tanacetum coccineum]|uniref:Zf-BED domain-containing protein n=1 Tax=Tanacetum coccineum TaxID=301880 RepID=A0ABQ5GD28_9ASTR
MWCLFDPIPSDWCKTDAHSMDFASNWLECLPAGSISIWEDLTTRFLAQFFPPGRTAKLRNDILMFQQHQGESLSEAWTRGGKLRDRNAEESWALLEDLCDNCALSRYEVSPTLCGDSLLLTPLCSDDIHDVTPCVFALAGYDMVHTPRNPQYAVSNTWIRRDLDNSTSNVLIPLDSWTSGLLVYKLPLSVEYGVSTSIGYGISSFLSNPTYSSQQINTAMTKVIKGEFDKIKDVKVEDVSLTCDTPLEVFNKEVSRLSGMDNDLFTYEVEVTNIPCNSKIDDDSEHEADDDMGYDSSDVAFIEWLASKNFNYKTTDHYTMKALWIYLIRGDDEDKPWINNGIRKDPKPVKHTCKPFNYKTGCSEWPTCSWRDDGYCNGGNLPETYIIGSQLNYQDYEWYEPLEDCELKNKALRNKAVMKGFIKDDDDESHSEQMKRWNIYANYDDSYEINHEREELCEVRESPVCNARRYMMIKYPFNNDDEYVAIKEDVYDNLTLTRKEACLAY